MPFLFYRLAIACSFELKISLHFNGLSSRWTWVSWYQNVSILDFIGAKDDGGGGDNWRYKACKPTLKSPPPINQHPPFYRLNALPVLVELNI